MGNVAGNIVRASEFGINGESLRKYLMGRLAAKMHFSWLAVDAVVVVIRVVVAVVAVAAMMLYSLLCHCRRQRVRIRYPGICSRGAPTVIEIVLIPSRRANSGELFAGSRSSGQRIKGEG